METQLRISPALWSCIVGDQPSVDAVVRALIVCQRRNTGAGLFSVAFDAEVGKLLDAGAGVPTKEICARIVNQVIAEAQLQANGGVRAAIPTPGAKVEPMHKAAWHMQGLTPVVAIFAAYCGGGGRTDISDRINAYFLTQFDPRDSPGASPLAHPYRVGGLVPTGERDAAELRADGRMVKLWQGWFGYADANTYIMEDETQLYAVCWADAFGFTTQRDLALDALAFIADRSDGIPMCASVRSGLPDWSRNVAPPSISIEQTARFIRAYESVRPSSRTELMERLRGVLRSSRVPGTREAFFPTLCPWSRAAVYALGKAPDCAGGVDGGAITFEYDRAVRNYREATTWPVHVLG